MLFIKKFTKVSSILLIVSGCSRLETFQSREVEGSEFDKKLIEYYKEFAQSEAEKCDWKTSRRFINKGMALLNGQEIEPEKLKWWNVPKEFLPELSEARNKLNEILNDDQILDQKPIAAAKAMYSFDCWVEEQAENWQEEDIKACKDNFYNAIAEIENSNILSSESQSHSSINNHHNSKLKGDKFELVDETKRIYFAYDSYKLSDEAIKKIKNITNEIRKINNEISEIDLNGFTDRTGPEWYNLQLSQKRALEVRKLMENLGIDKNKIKVFAYGFANPLINSLNKEPKNRRVEIIILDN